MGFVTSPYPIILSLEMHCSPEQQEVLADICVDVLGDRLLMPHMYEGAPPPALPSPEALRGKVLVKAKKRRPAPHEVLGTRAELAEAKGMSKGPDGSSKRLGERRGSVGKMGSVKLT